MVKNVINLPDECRKQAKSGSTNPIYLTIDCVEPWLPLTLDDILDYDGSEIGFVELLRTRLAQLFVKIAK